MVKTRKRNLPTGDVPHPSKENDPVLGERVEACPVGYIDQERLNTLFDKVEVLTAAM